MWQQYFQLSKEAMHQYGQVDLVVWPESMFPDSLVTFDADAEVPAWYQGTRAEFYAKLPEWAEACPTQLARVAKELDASLLVGLDTWHYGTHGDKVFASAACVARNGDFLGRYDKMHLIPYGEYVPFSEAFPWMLRLTPLPRSAVPGSKPAAFKIGDVWVAPSICYESVLTHVIRGQVNSLKAEGHEPEVLVNVTNDGWFWGSSELDLHLVCSVFRAVECRKPFLVAANTGFSAWIDGNGRIQRKGPRHATGTLLAEVLLDRRTSWYLLHGDWFSGLCLLGCVVFGVVGQRDRMRRRSDSHAAQATA
jgi:apolipoprotein N-acyltransferase